MLVSLSIFIMPNHKQKFIQELDQILHVLLVEEKSEEPSAWCGKLVLMYELQIRVLLI